MHIEKYKSEAVAPIIAHDYRERESTLNRSNIDKNRSKNNLIFTRGKRINCNEINNLKKIQKETTGRTVRKDAVVLGSIVVTKPPEVQPEDTQEFFKQSCAYLTDKLQKNGLSANKALITGTVHFDETTPHLHFLFTPIKEECGKLTFSYKTIVNRQFYQTVHEDLSKHIEKKLGYKTSILIKDDEKLSSFQKRKGVNQKDFQQVKEKHTSELNNEIKSLEQQKNNLIQEKQELLDEKKALQQRSKLCEEECGKLMREQEVLQQKLQLCEKKYGMLMREQMELNKVFQNLKPTSNQELLAQKNSFQKWLKKSSNQI